MNCRIQNLQQGTNRVIPFLRWAGGKTWLLKKFDQFLPHDFRNYYEPFLGSGAVFFHLKQLGLLNEEVVLSDLNKDLVDCFVQIRDNVEDVIDHLSTYRNEREFYYQMRRVSPLAEDEKAARFIYLNRTSFNGIYRVNLNGVYNVPYGSKKYKVLFDVENLRGASTLLKGVEIVHRDFKDCAEIVHSKDLVFLDPPTQSRTRTTVSSSIIRRFSLGRIKNNWLRPSEQLLTRALISS